MREMPPSVMFANVRLAVYYSCQLLWNNPVWLVSSNFLPTLQLTKLHQLAMQHIPLPSLGQSNPTFPGTYPWLRGEVRLSPCLHPSLKSHYQNTCVTTERSVSVSFLSVCRLPQVFVFFCLGVRLDENKETVKTLMTQSLPANILLFIMQNTGLRNSIKY